jgi:hypothetical protein
MKIRKYRIKKTEIEYYDGRKQRVTQGTFNQNGFHC